ncbi:unnamed protein product [Adineta steineri]|uniref:Uncharacterized protein n=2 Tax=Adineta steineri TaxID=433720 RepID=A0A814FAW1_9BILA|nr:unnamed protein product [Adineta steineri]CAF1005620.1 unnamed protein product [Adineta steineri]CAF1075828.1 unnamed protein product [Adineta steineri]
MDALSPTKVEYCLRPTDNIDIVTPDFLNTRDQNYTFSELKKMNITAYEIFVWSASIDLAENYQYYLDQKNKSLLSNEIFFNCTKPWFGSRCQYSFEIPEKEASRDLDLALPVAKHTCYILLECNRGESFFCLDWREICDGRVDCLNDGIDEMHCVDLEINECKSDEYRCHNGLCIPKYYRESRLFSALCLDQSDAWETIQCPSFDPTLDLFQCEEHTCPPGPKQFACGDGHCVEDFDECDNGRHLMLLKSLSSQGNLSYHCWLAMVCLTKIIDQVNRTSCQSLFESSDIRVYLRSCDVLIQFPIYPVLFGHVHFLYIRQEVSEIDINSALVPDYICYDELLCDYLSATFRNKNHICRHRYDMGLKSNVEYPSWKAIIDLVKPYFSGCHIRYTNKHQSEHSSLYRCQNSSKLISKHRILDNIIDCYLEDDERDFRLSCSLDDLYRFKCFNETQCRSPIFDLRRCPFKEDQIATIENILFNQICDRNVDILPQLIDGRNHTDETNCENWPCNNIYTRCDGFWTCQNGEDEENCRPSNCSGHFLDCISSSNNTFICLPAEQIGNGIIDCLGGIDELQLCQMKNYRQGISYDFRCLDDDRCIESSEFCDFNDETFYQDLCDEWILHNFTELQNNLCHIGTLGRLSFTLKKSQFYPFIENQIADEIIGLTIKSSHDANSINIEFDDFTLSSQCIRGRSIYRWLDNENYRPNCYCPPNYYGELCQYQNQRVSLTLTLLTSDRRNAYAIFIKLIDDDDDRQEIQSYDQIIYVSNSGTCGQTFHIYLLYSTRMNILSKNYSIHIDLYYKHSLEYVASWYFQIPFRFLPVHRLVVLLTLKTNQLSNSHACPLKCQEGTCMKYINEEKFFCHCKRNWSGALCHIFVSCDDCSSDSLCMGYIHNRSICICPSEKFGSRCLLKHPCPKDYCQNNGSCIVRHERTESSYLCLCSEHFRGNQCEIPKSKLEISFRNIERASYFVAYIYDFIQFEASMIQRPILKKLTRMQNIVTFYMPYPFEVVIIKIADSFYLAVLQQISVSNISTSVDLTRRCPSFTELFKPKQMELPRIQRIKLYHQLCQIHSNLKCFFDEFYMCLCTTEQYANCFIFNYHVNFSCLQNGYCQNGGECFEDVSLCPTITICDCVDCFFGDRCQFYARGIGLTLDDMLRYAILANHSINDQSIVIKMCIFCTFILFFAGLINSTLSFLTFQSPKSRQVGSGVYLLTSSITSMITVTTLLIKFWFILLTQMNLSANRSTHYYGCILIEPLLKVFLLLNNWLNTCVSIERAVSAYKGIGFNKTTSLYAARRVIIILPFLVIGSNMYEYISRGLFDDVEEQRVWCVTLYSKPLYDSTIAILFLHLLIPLIINLGSAVLIVCTVSRQRALSQLRQTCYQHFKEQLYEHKHLIIGPIILVILALPLVVTASLFRCVKASHNSWWLLCSYFISFIPSTLTFIIYILPSDLYSKEFKKSFENLRQCLRLH